MNIFTFLPLIGGAVSLGLGAWLVTRERRREASKIFFFLSFLALGLYGVLEGVAYLSPDEGQAKLFLLASKAAAFLAPFFIFAFASALRGKENGPKALFGIALGWAVVAPFYTIESLERTPWGWSVNFCKPVLVASFLFVIVFMSLALYELSSMLKELKGSESPHYSGLRTILVGFSLWLFLSLGANLAIHLSPSHIPPPFSYLQAISCVIVTYGFLRSKNGNGKKRRTIRNA